MKKMMILAALAIAITASATIKSSWPMSDELTSRPTTKGKLPMMSETTTQISPSAWTTAESDTTDVWIHPAER